MGNHEARHDSPRSCRDALSKIGYTRLDKIGSEVIRKEQEISAIQDVRSQHKQNWINHLERMETPDSRNTQLQASRKRRLWMPQETMATRGCRNRSNDLIHGGR
jgi:hypothetical protein